MALGDGRAHSIELPIKADAAGVLHGDGEGQGGDWSRVAHFDALIIKERAVLIDHSRYCYSTSSCYRSIYSECNCGGMR